MVFQRWAHRLILNLALVVQGVALLVLGLVLTGRLG